MQVDLDCAVVLPHGTGGTGRDRTGQGGTVYGVYCGYVGLGGWLVGGFWFDTVT